MEPSTSEVARQCGKYFLSKQYTDWKISTLILLEMKIITGASGIEMDQPNVRALTTLTVSGRGGSKGSNLSVCGVQDASDRNEQARGGQNSIILPNRGSHGTCIQLTRGMHGGCGTINKEARGVWVTTRGGRGTTGGGRGTTGGGRSTIRGGRKTICGPNPPTPTQTISASQVNYATRM